MRIRELPEREVTEPALFLRRREFLRGGALAAGAALLPACPDRSTADDAPRELAGWTPPAERGPYDTDEPVNSWSDATTYNNFYELGTGKDDPAENAHHLTTKPWSVAVEGEVAKPGVVPLETLLAGIPVEQRIYRLRCVEAWSMVIPWLGVPLAAVLKRCEPTSQAKYVAFETLLDPKRLPGQRRGVLPWPYREGLRMDEAMHPLTLLATGMYGRTLPGQNGAPLRLVVPWKYGFKSIKSIVRIALVRERPETTWNQATPNEYGFYANVNPEVDHPRWSQKRERRIGEWRKRPTLPFNGYAEEVAPLYSNLNLRVHF